MKKTRILVILIMMIITMFSIGTLSCYATGEDTEVESSLTLDGLLEKGSEFINQGSGNAGITNGEIAETFLPIGKILVGIATGVVFVVMAIMGIKWITATPDKQALLKQQLIGLVVAVVVIYGAVGIWSLISNMMEHLTTV